MTTELIDLPGSVSRTSLLFPKQTESLDSTLSLTPSELELYRRHLPSSALDIAEVIGMSLAVLLIASCKGNQFSMHGRDFEFLSELIGNDAASKLKRWMGSVPITIPTCSKAKRAVVSERIRAEFDRLTLVDKLSSRKAVRDLTSVFSLHERTIWRILKTVENLPTPHTSSAGVVITNSPTSSKNI